MLLITGCSSSVQVPEDAQLVWYGKPPVNFSSIPTISGPGQLFLYDDSGRKVVSVIPVSDNSRFNFTGLQIDHNYALYFVAKLPTPSLTAKPATHPAF